MIALGAGGGVYIFYPLVHYSIMTPAMTLRRVGYALCMSYIASSRSQFRKYNRAYAYRGLTAFASLCLAVSAVMLPTLP